MYIDSKPIKRTYQTEKALDFPSKKSLINSFVLLNFNYYTLVWMFASSKSLCKIGNLHKRALRFMLDDNSGSYERILKKSGKFSMNTKTKHKLCIEIYNFNPSFMKKRLSSMPVRQQHKLNLNIPKNRQVTFGTKSLESLGPKIWSNLSYHIKSTKNLNVFENLVKK